MRRLLLSAAAGMIGFVGSLVVLPAHAAPTAPYSAMTVNGTEAQVVVDAATDNLQFASGNGGELVELIGGGHSVSIAPPTGQKLAVGTYSAIPYFSPTQYNLTITNFNGHCYDGSGSVTVHEVVREPQHDSIVAFAASYDRGAGCPSMHGELRWKSTRPYAVGAENGSTVAIPGAPGQAPPLRTVRITSAGSQPLQLGAPSITGDAAGHVTVAGNTCTGAALGYGQSCTVGLQAEATPAGRWTGTLTLTDNTTFGKQVFDLVHDSDVGSAGAAQVLEPVRLLDTRSGNGAPAGKLGPKQTLHLQIAGRGGIPAAAELSAVVLNVTVTGGTSGSYVTVYPTGIERPGTSSINFPAGWTGANQVTIPVGAGGQIDLYNDLGSVDVVVDVSAYYYAGGYHEAGSYFPVEPARVLDTRVPGFGGVLQPRQAIQVSARYGQVYDPHVSAYLVNLTAVTPQAGGYLTAWGNGSTPPLASVLNFNAGTVVSNTTVVPASAARDGSFLVYNGSAGQTHVTVDVLGLYDDGQVFGGTRFTPVTPTRLFDSRVSGFAVDAGKYVTLMAAPPKTGERTRALALNFTGVLPTSDTFLTLYADNEYTRPFVSTLNIARGTVKAQGTVVELNHDNYGSNTFTIYNSAGRIDHVTDVTGRFDFPAAGPLPPPLVPPFLHLPLTTPIRWQPPA